MTLLYSSVVLRFYAKKKGFAICEAFKIFCCNIHISGFALSVDKVKIEPKI